MCFVKKTIEKNDVFHEIWTPNDSNDTILNLKNSELLLLKKIQCTSLLNTSFKIFLLFIKFFDNISLHFLSPHVKCVYVTKAVL